MRFWFSPQDPIALRWLRALVGLALLIRLLPFAAHVNAFFGLAGWVDQRAYIELARVPNARDSIGWSVLYLCGQNRALLEIAYWVSICLLVLYALGFFPRITSVCAWLIAISFTTNPAYGPSSDHWLILLTFYIMLAYWLGLLWRLLSRLFASKTGSNPADSEYGSFQESVGVNIALRLLQVHFALFVLTSGLGKLQHGDWWSGLALWYPLHAMYPGERETLDVASATSSLYLVVLSALTYATLAWQIGFPVFAWQRRWRPVLLIGAAASWAGAVFIYHEPPEVPAFALACLSYLTSEEWHRVASLVPWRTQEPGTSQRQPKRPHKSRGMAGLKNPAGFHHS
jgi:hypothetical protein